MNSTSLLQKYVSPSSSTSRPSCFQFATVVYSAREGAPSRQRSTRTAWRVRARSPGRGGTGLPEVPMFSPYVTNSSCSARSDAVASSPAESASSW